LIFIDREGWSSGLVEHPHMLRLDLDLTRGKVWILSTFRPVLHHAFNLDHPFIPHSLERLMSFRGRIWIGDNLHQPKAIAQVDKSHPSVIPPAVHPAGQF